MSEETKTAEEGEYVMMGSVPPAPKVLPGLDDPNLSQEDRDHRLAIALQQQENAAVYEAHKKKSNAYKAAQTNRTGRSGTFSRLAAVRDKDAGMFSVPSDYTTEHAYVKSGEYLPQAGISDAELLKGATPQQIADFKLAKEIQTVEQAGAGTAREMAKITSEESDAAVAQGRRTGLSTYAKK